jgi:hypothetical protein
MDEEPVTFGVEADGQDTFIGSGEAVVYDVTFFHVG